MANNRYGNYYRPSFFGGFQFFPPMIKMLLISNGAVFLAMFLLGNYRIGDITLQQFFYQAFALWPIGYGFGIWQLFTYMWIHAGLAHIFFNMLALWMFGMELEHVFGSRKFLIYYLLCGFGGGLANLLIAPLFTTVGPTVGASGAIFGVLLAFGMMFPNRPIYIYFLLPIKAKYFVVMYMALEIFSVGSVDGIAHFAHLGGALVGFLYLIADGYRFGSAYSGNRMNSMFSNFSSKISNFTQAPKRQDDYGEVSDAKVYDMKEYQQQDETQKHQQQIDEILDKISKHGYQSLTDEEKRILFEASKKLN